MLWGEYLARVQSEEVVAGIRRRDKLAKLAESMPKERDVL
jgi:hypothetical protein